MEFDFDLENPLPTAHDLHSDTLTTLFHIESHHMPSNPLDCSICIRREIISLISHFSRNFDPFLSYLSINYMDRFLSVQPLPSPVSRSLTSDCISWKALQRSSRKMTTFVEGKPWIYKLVSFSCISLALKMSETELSVTDIQGNGGSLFDSRTIERMEYLILSALKWRMRSITPFCFINFFLSLFKFKDQPFRQALKDRATEIIFQAQNEIKLLEFRPSIISASALLSASHELFPLQYPCYQKAMLSCSYVNKENLLSCYNVMQDVVIEGCESIFGTVSSTSTSTPLNVLDLQYCSSTSGSDKKQNQTSIAESEGNAYATVRLERDLKRRKIGVCKRDNTIQLSQNQQY